MARDMLSALAHGIICFGYDFISDFESREWCKHKVVQISVVYVYNLANLEKVAASRAKKGGFESQIVVAYVNNLEISENSDPGQSL
ncbi:hypothetical protein CEXT_573151 [Caerostris extrusa]|uniref:Uncharacterized protein n=1 Tax=Caerostris extrusa TaxID=172846 RepID=A0AAV4XLC6_CAEEX|nr:hypothetical protein CEXT_573151 [Caerostris extrusa]